MGASTDSSHIPNLVVPSITERLRSKYDGCGLRKDGRLLNYPYLFPSIAGFFGLTSTVFKDVLGKFNLAVSDEAH